MTEKLIVMMFTNGKTVALFTTLAVMFILAFVLSGALYGLVSMFGLLSPGLILPGTVGCAAGVSIVSAISAAIAA